MYNRTMSIKTDVNKNSYNAGDILYINEERWVVTHIKYDYYSSTIYCEPLAECVANAAYDRYGNMTIADHIEILCDAYENRIKGEF